MLAIVIATAVAVPLSFAVARPNRATAPVRAANAVLRTAVLVLRSIPPPVWALVVLFVLFPGPLPGGVALGLYTIGVLSRLDADVIESSDPRPAAVLRAAGATRLAASTYGRLPIVGPRFAALSMYRWEVATREVVIVGLVGAGGLGRLLAQQSAAFDEGAMLTTIIALVVLALAVDLTSAQVRRALR